MSRSRKRSPYISCCCGADTKARRLRFRAWRQLTNRLARIADPDVSLPPLREVSNRYDFPSDGGKVWLHPSKMWEGYRARWMRK